MREELLKRGASHADGTLDMDWSVDPTSERTPSKQIVEYVLQRLVCGDLEVGDALPPVRRMAADARVSHNTVLRAWRELEELEVIQTRAGTGVFVTPLGQEIAIARLLEMTLEGFDSAVIEAMRVGHPLTLLARRLDGLRGREA